MHRRTVFGVALLLGAWAAWLHAEPSDGAGLKLTAQEVAVRREKAGDDPVQLLDLAGLADAKDAARLREQVKQLLLDRKRVAGPEELDALARRLAVVLPTATRSPAEVQEVLGPPRSTARQILYRRYVEQWHYDSPLSLCVVFDARKGQEPRLQTVHVTGAGKP